MPHGRPPESHEDVEALAAIWGREASATAAPQQRPPADPAPRRLRRQVGPRHLVVAGAAVAVVVGIVAAVVVVGPDGDRTTDRRTDGASSTTPPPWEPGWTTEVRCPRFEVSAELRTTACPLATDDERVYVIEELDEAVLGDGPVPTLVATGVADGRAVWAVPFADGAREVLRYPSTVLVVAPDATHAVDPTTGEVRWTAPGFPVAPLGRDHILLGVFTDNADGGQDTTMTVVHAGTGASTFSVTGPSTSLFAHPCGDAGLVVVSDLERLTAHEVADGAQRWSVESPHHGGFDPVVCSAAAVLEVRVDGFLVARDARSGAVAGTTAAAVPGDEGFARIVEVTGETVVVVSDDRLEGFTADAALASLWQLDLAAGGREAVVAPAGGGVAVAVAGDRAAWFGPDGTAGPQVTLGGRREAVIEADRLVAWSADEVLVAAATDLGRDRRLPLADVRRVAMASAHVVVTTRDEVRLYPFDP